MNTYDRVYQSKQIVNDVMKFNIICEIDEEGRYVVECPDLPGCLSEGDTLDEAMDNINEAIKTVLPGFRKG